MKRLLIAALLLVSIALIPGAASALPETQFTALASGAQEVPPVLTRTKGSLSLNFRDDLALARYSLSVRRGREIVAAHLHCGVAGSNGPVVVVLFGGFFNGSGQIAAGILRSGNVIPQDAATCGLPINNIASLLTAIRQDLVYVNVHSLANLGGEVRAQVLQLH